MREEDRHGQVTGVACPVVARQIRKCARFGMLLLHCLLPLITLGFPRYHQGAAYV